MIFFWMFYYFLLIFICFLFKKINKNKFLNFFTIPLIFGFFGSVWFVTPGSNEVAPIIAIFFLESSILNFNGYDRIVRPLISSIFIFELISLTLYFYLKNFSKN